MWPHSVYKQCFTHSHTYHQLLIEQNRIPNSHHCEIGEAEPESVGDIASFILLWRRHLCDIFSSYLHCEWKTQEELEVTDKRVNQKIKRYNQKQSQNHSYMMNVSTQLSQLIIVYVLWTRCSDLELLSH